MKELFLRKVHSDVENLSKVSKQGAVNGSWCVGPKEKLQL